MECEFNGRKIKYDEGKFWVWREKWGKLKLKNPYWYELKGKFNNKTGYTALLINCRYFYYHRVVYFIHNPDWDIHNSSQDNSIDHIDQDKLNNSIENLRVVSHSQNMWNRDAKGYSFCKARGKYEAEITVNGKRKRLGRFENEDDAMNAYLNAKAIHHRIPQATPL